MNKFKSAHGIMFHHFHGDNHLESQGSINKNDFDKIITFTKKNYNLLDAEEWYKLALNNRLKEEDVCLTFDDNLKCQFDIAVPILNKHNVTAFWFIHTIPLTGKQDKLETYRFFRSTHYKHVNDFYEEFILEASKSNFIADFDMKMAMFDPNNFLKEFSFYSPQDKVFRYLRDKELGRANYDKIMDSMMAEVNFKAPDLWMTKDQIKELRSNGHVIGLHSHTHPTEMRELSVYEQRMEYLINRDTLSDLLGEKIETVSHPCNSYNNDTINILKGLGIKIGFRSNLAVINTSLFEFPRRDHILFLDQINSIA